MKLVGSAQNINTTQNQPSGCQEVKTSGDINYLRSGTKSSGLPVIILITSNI